LSTAKKYDPRRWTTIGFISRLALLQHAWCDDKKTMPLTLAMVMHPPILPEHSAHYMLHFDVLIFPVDLLTDYDTLPASDLPYQRNAQFR